MPNRILKESIKSSHEIDQLSFFQECVFYRLIVSADDFGRYYGDSVLLKSFLFPRKEDIKAADIDAALSIMNKIGLISLYQDEKGDRYLQFVSWRKHQQQRSNKSKFPDPASPVSGTSNNSKSIDSSSIADDINCLQLDSKCPRKRERERDRETGTTTKTRSESDTDDVDGDLLQIQNDHNEILDAAQEAGFPGNQATWDKLIALYADYGKETVLAGISACVDQGKTSIAYLKGCCKNAANAVGKPKSGSKGNVFSAMLEASNDDSE